MAKWSLSSRLSFFSLCFGSFLNWMSYGIIYPFFAISIFDPHPLFLTEASNAARGFWLGALLASTPIGQFLSAPIIGTLSDRLGRKPLLQLTALIILLGYCLAAMGIWQQSFALLFIGRTITGIGGGNLSVINSSVADISEPQKKAQRFALVAMANGIGFAAGPFLGGKLAAWGFDLPFIVAGFLSLCSFLFYCFLFFETLTKKKEEGAHLASFLSQLIKTASLPKIRSIFLTFFFFCFGWSFYWEFISVTWIKLYHLNVSQIGNFYAYGSLFFVMSSGLLIRPIVKRFAPLKVLFTALIALGCALLFLFHASIELYWIFIALQQFLIAIILPIGTALISNAVASNQQGETLGAFQALQSFAFAATPLLGGILLELNYSMPLLLGGVSMLLACLVLFPTYAMKTRR